MISEPAFDSVDEHLTLHVTVWHCPGCGEMIEEILCARGCRASSESQPDLYRLAIVTDNMLGTGIDSDNISRFAISLSCTGSRMWCLQ
jgi:hypothetical protein